MNGASDTKACPMCAETIKAAARKCPFCQTRQGRWILWHQDLVPALGALFLMGISILFVLWLLTEEARPGGRSFARHRADLSVARVALEQSKEGPEFWISGFASNSGASPWRVHELEVRFLDEQGRFFDVRHPSVKDPFVVAPGCEHAFRVRLGTLAWTNAAAVTQVRVQAATDGRFAFKTD
jgi:hypothetical protein